MDIIALCSSPAGCGVDESPGRSLKRSKDEGAERLYWLDEGWPGKLALDARPRGGDWLRDEIAGWKTSGDIEAVLSYSQPEEERDLDLRGEAERSSRARIGIRCASDSRSTGSTGQKRSWFEVLEELDRALSNGRNVLVHCRQGVGRSWVGGSLSASEKGHEPGSGRTKRYRRLGA